MEFNFRYVLLTFLVNTSTGHKPNKIWADKGSESYNRSIKTWLKRII